MTTASTTSRPATAFPDGQAAALPDEGHVSAAVADVLAERAGHLFGLMGNGNAHLSRLTRCGFPFTSARHEAATVAMAEPAHRATGGIAAATTTYGAGFTNAYTTLSEARPESIPLVYVATPRPATAGRSTSTRPKRPKRPASPRWWLARTMPPQ